MNGLADIPFHIRIAGTTLYNDSGDTLRCNIRNSKLHFGPNGIIVTSQEPQTVRLRSICGLWLPGWSL
ncbi:hypothetical protein DPMN_047054 [Dreissena polymorpha]|uniref:Uncharacterized protein n=1 Tax=Dreissena polymorpha TaxID=45954 RepID=A0A9D4I138_DREPO|nr:hypothetical protein DPMN_047054 [Dreissena polymorpha]